MGQMGRSMTVYHLWRSFNDPIDILGGGLNIFYVHSYLVKISNLTNIFQWVETTN